ncbi:MAG: hypothetical protein U9Q03_01955 [Patescibacteria group bacterium]|nr:hypothetical protein [Patescibacteria group bacterium]
MLVRIFLDFGWIPFIFIVIWGGWHLWVLWRQNLFVANKVTTTILAIDVPRQNEQTAKAVEHIFSTLGGAYSGLDRYEKYWLGKIQPTFSFEIASVGGYVQFMVHTWNKHRDLVEAAIYAQYPDAEIIEIADYTDTIPKTFPNPEWNTFGTEFTLKRPSHLPIRTYFQFEHTSAEYPFKDPLSTLLEILASLKANEQIWVQFLITPTDSKWKDDGQKAVDKMMGKTVKPKASPLDALMWLPKGVAKELAGIFETGEPPKKEEKKKDEFKMLNMSPGERGVLEAIQMKLSKIGFKTKIRVVYAGKHDIFSKKRFTALKGSMMQFSALDMNEIKTYGKVTPKSDYFYQRWTEQAKKTSVVRRFRSRSNEGGTPFILNTEELATLYHYPMLDVKAPLIKKTDAKRAEPPSRLPTGDFTESPFKVAPAEAEEPKAEEEEGEPPANLPFA